MPKKLQPLDRIIIAEKELDVLKAEMKLFLDDCFIKHRMIDQKCQQAADELEIDYIGSEFTQTLMNLIDDESPNWFESDLCSEDI